MLNPKEIFNQFHFISPLVYAWTVPDGLAYFEGHFQGHPVLPAIALIDLSLEAIRHNSSESVKLKKISQGKFLAVIQPGASLEVRLENKAPNEWMILWQEGKKTVAQLKIHTTVIASN